MERVDYSGYLRPDWQRRQTAEEALKLTEALQALKKAHGLLMRVNGGEARDMAVAAIKCAHMLTNELRQEKGKAPNKGLPATETLDTEFDDALEAELE